MNKFIANHEYESALLKMAGGNDPAASKNAIQCLIEYHQGLIRSLSKKYHRMIGVFDKDDLIQEFTITLMNCAVKYDPDFGVKFSTYFRSAAANSFQNLIQGNLDQIKRPESQMQFNRERHKAFKALLVKLTRPPCDEELAAKMDLPVKLYLELAAIYDKKYNSFEDALWDRDDSITIGDIIKSDDPSQEELTVQKVQNEQFRKKIKKLSVKLRPIEQKFIFKLLDGQTINEIRSELMIDSNEYARIVRRIKNPEIKKMMQVFK